MYYTVWSISKDLYSNNKNINPCTKFTFTSKKRALAHKDEVCKWTGALRVLGVIILESATKTSIPTGLEFYNSEGFGMRAKSIWGASGSSYIKRDYIAYLLGETKDPPFKATLVTDSPKQYKTTIVWRRDEDEFMLTTLDGLYTNSYEAATQAAKLEDEDDSSTLEGVSYEIAAFFSHECALQHHTW